LRRYREAIVPAGELHPLEHEYLLTGAAPDRSAPAEVRGIEFDVARASALWSTHRRKLLAEAKRRRFVPYGLDLVEGRSVPGLKAWRRHEPDPRPTLHELPVLACPHCGATDFARARCLA
jgi:hypothetical protein